MRETERKNTCIASSNNWQGLIQGFIDHQKRYANLRTARECGSQCKIKRLLASSGKRVGITESSVFRPPFAKQKQRDPLRRSRSRFTRANTPKTLLFRYWIIVSTHSVLRQSCRSKNDGRKVQQEMERSTCRSCGQTGRWAGDDKCPACKGGSKGKCKGGSEGKKGKRFPGLSTFRSTQASREPNHNVLQQPFKPRRSARRMSFQTRVQHEKKSFSFKTRVPKRENNVVLGPGMSTARLINIVVIAGTSWHENNIVAAPGTSWTPRIDIVPGTTEEMRTSTNAVPGAGPNDGFRQTFHFTEIIGRWRRR